MTRPDAIPARPEEITPEWLSGALASRFSGVDCTAVEVVAHHSGTTGRARLRLRYARDVGAPQAVFAKLAPDGEAQRLIVQATGMGRQEARFFAGLAEEVPVRVPQPLFGAWSEDGSAYLMLMEDLVDTGCRFPDGVAGVDAATGRAAVVSLARLHARYWDSARFATDLAWVAPPARHEMGAALVAQVVEREGAARPPVFAELGRLYAERADAVHDLWERGVPTLAHGDAHVGNLFVDADGKTPGFLDWGIVSRQPGWRDFAELLTTSVPTPLRRAEERAWLGAYLETLASCGVAAPDLDEAWRGYAIHAGYALVASASTLAMGDQWQPLPFIEEALARVLAAVEDLDSLALIRAGLAG